MGDSIYLDGDEEARCQIIEDRRQMSGHDGWTFTFILVQLQPTGLSDDLREP